jgi:hypothetical protein
MGKLAASVLVGIEVGVGLAHWSDAGGERVLSGLAVEDHSAYVSGLNEFETSLALARSQRLALAEELESLGHMVAALPGLNFHLDDGSQSLPAELLAASSIDATNGSVTGRVRESSLGAVPRTGNDLELYLRQQRFDRFVAAGIAPERAFAIMRREEDLEMEALRARHVAARSGATREEVAALTPLARLRSELGDAEYAKYLDARGRPISVGVRQVVENSQAEFAGVKSGDEIVAYNGQRVFDMNELAALIQQAEAGESVPLEMIRDGRLIQVYVDAGPIGINSAGRSPGL